MTLLDRLTSMVSDAPEPPEPTGLPEPARTGNAPVGDAGDRAPVVLSDRRGVLVVRSGAVVVKAHRPSTDEAELRARVGVAADPRLRDILVPPRGPVRTAGDRLVTFWPAGRPVDPADPDAAPWAEGARLLARLHAVPATVFDGTPPPAGGPARVGRAVARLPAAGSAAEVVRRAFATLPAPVNGTGRPDPAAGLAVLGVRAVPAGGSGLVHGDWHLGQLVRTPDAGWRLIDIDDLGVGDPVWDLARPAALYAAGVLPPADWETFLGAYRDAGGCAVPADGDPWPRLNVPAQALAVQMAATCVVMAADDARPLDERESALVLACGRIAAMTDAL